MTSQRGLVTLARHLRRAMPSLVTALRLALLPFIWQLWTADRLILALILYAVAVATDVLDGRLARRLGTTTNFGAFFDVVADVLFLVVLLLLLGLHGVVPVWLFAAPLIAAIVFFLTSRRATPQYDPIGKHYGSVLYVLVGVILWIPTSPIVVALWSLIVALSVIVLGNRLRRLSRASM